jgi:hypothetical protein
MNLNANNPLLSLVQFGLLPVLRKRPLPSEYRRGRVFMQVLEYQLDKAQEQRKAAEKHANAINMSTKQALLDARIYRWGSDVAVAVNQDTHQSMHQSSVPNSEVESLPAPLPSEDHFVKMRGLNEWAEQIRASGVAQDAKGEDAV